MKNRNYIKLLTGILFSILLLFVIKSSVVQNFTIPGEVVTPYPTIINLGVEWNIKGDDNLNGTVTVQFREKGTSDWKQGMPLRRVPAGKIYGFKWGNKHSGSIFDLNPNTLYEIKLNLNDPDGGSAEKIVEVATRPVPVVNDSAEIIELLPGVHDTLFTKSGTKDHPVVYQCSEGTATYQFIDLKNKEWVYIEGLRIVNTEVTYIEDFGAGIRMDGAQNCVVRGCTINSVFGIVADKPGATNCYFCDNVLTGTCEWKNNAMGKYAKNLGEGIQITGSGNVICYNLVSGFWDCISTMEGSRCATQTGIDIYNNDIYQGDDDAIEADFSFSNCRIMRNRITNCCVGLSSQPGLGGPNYFIRNVMYNVIHAAFKLKNFSRGDVILHNTVIKVGAGLNGNQPMDFAYFRNNLAIGGPNGNVNYAGYGAGPPSAAYLLEPGKHSDLDYDAVGVYGTGYVATIGNKAFSEVEKHGIERITIEDVFNDVKFPYPPFPEKEVPDLRPKPNSKVVDAGVRIPNVNDDYKGKAPDCGAYESGQELPHYGPRKEKGEMVQEVFDTLIHSAHKSLSTIYGRPLEIKKEYCGKSDSEIAKKKTDRKSVLQGEIDGIDTYYLELFKDDPYLIKPRQNSVSLYLITHGKGIITQGVRQFEVNGLNLFVPSIMEEASVLADTGDFGMLEIVIRLTSAEYQSLKQKQNKLPYFVDYKQCRQYKEAIKSEKTISRMILPEDIIPRFCMGSVETCGPDTVGAHSHPMLEQLFYGLKSNDCIVKADGIKTAFKENILLHIPLGSRHGVDVEEGKILNYVWMDLFRSEEDMGYIKENHIMKDN